MSNPENTGRRLSPQEEFYIRRCHKSGISLSRSVGLLLDEIDALRKEIAANTNSLPLLAARIEQCTAYEARIRELEAEVQKAREAMGNGTDDSRWRPGETAVDALIRERDTERSARVAARAALQGVADVVDPNGDHYFWRKKEADLAGTVKSIVEDRERIDAEWRKRAQLGMCVMDAPNGPECWCGAPSEVEAGLCLRHARELERLSHAEKAEARVRELEAENGKMVNALARVALKPLVDAATVDTIALADLAETRAQLARLREASKVMSDAAGDLAQRIDEAPNEECQFCEMVLHDEGGADHEPECRVAVLTRADAALREALSTPGPTLAEIRREAQVEALRAAADRHTTPDEIRMWLRQRADDLEAGRE